MVLSHTSTSKRESAFRLTLAVPRCRTDTEHKCSYPDPGVAYTATVSWTEDKATQVFETTTDFFTNNQDLDAFPALCYYYKDASAPNTVVPLRERGFTIQLNAIYFGGDLAQVNATFGKFYTGASSISFQAWTLRSLDQYLLDNYPYGYQRIFYGKGHTISTSDFYNQTFAIYQETINGMIARGEDPGHTLWVDECKCQSTTEMISADSHMRFRPFPRTQRQWPLQRQRYCLASLNNLPSHLDVRGVDESLESSVHV